MKDIQHSIIKQSLLIIIILLLLYTYIYPLHCKNKCNKLFKGNKENECLERRVPRISRILETAQHLLYTNNSLVIFGDKELELMNKIKDMFYLIDNNDISKGYIFIDNNKDNSNNEKRIGIELMKIFLNSSEEMEIAIPDIFYGYPPVYQKDKIYWKEKNSIRRLLFEYSDYNKQYFTSQISAPYRYSSNSYCELLDEVYNTLREIWMNKNIIIIKSFNRFHYTNLLFNSANDIKIISIHNSNNLSIIEDIEKSIIKEDKDKIIILITQNPFFVILEDKLVKQGRRVIMLNDIDIDYYKYKYKNNISFELFSI